MFVRELGPKVVDQLIIPVTEQEQRNRAIAASRISRTLETRPEKLESFLDAFKRAEQDGRNGLVLNPQLYAEYSQIVIGENQDNPWEKRYADERMQKKSELLFKNFYRKTEEEGGLTIETLGELFDRLGLYHLFLDSNTRTSVIAITNILKQFGYDAPQFPDNTGERFKKLHKKYEGRRKYVSIELLKESLPVVPPSRKDRSQA